MEQQEYYKKMLNELQLSYDILVVHHLNEEKQIMLSDKNNPQKCRFCGRKYPDVKFNKVAHAISHMVENRYLKSDYECDECNEIFSKYESEYSSYMNLYHTLFMVHGKGGIPKYKLNSKENSKIVIEDDKLIKINIQEGEEPLIIWEEENKENIIKIRGKRTYTPQNVLRALVKMALTIMPQNELTNLTNTMNWLMCKSCSGPIMPISFRIYKNTLPFTSVMIFKKKQGNILAQPHYIFLLAYKNIVIQAPLPMVNLDDEFKTETISMPLIPTPIDEFSRPLITQLVKLSGKDKIKGEELSINMKYDSVEQTSPKKRDS